jgi:hypothetical protein
MIVETDRIQYHVLKPVFPSLIPTPASAPQNWALGDNRGIPEHEGCAVLTQRMMMFTTSRVPRVVFLPFAVSVTMGGTVRRTRPERLEVVSPELAQQRRSRGSAFKVPRNRI